MVTTASPQPMGDEDMVNDDVEVVSEHRRRVVRIREQTVVLTVKYEPIRVEHGLLPYYAIFQVIHDGKLMDEDDGPFEGHTSWEDAFSVITAKAKQSVEEEYDDDGARIE